MKFKLLFLKKINFKIFIKYFIINLKWGLGIGDWGLGIGGWAQYPKPQTPNPKPQFNNF